MTINKKISALATGFLCTALTFSTYAVSVKADGHTPIATHTITTTTQPDPTVLKYAVNGYLWAVHHHKVENTGILTVVDFNLPSYKKRLWVIDLRNDRILMNIHVAQGKNTGAIFATRFSNRPGSLESSPGVFTTEDIYNGEHGESLRVDGLEKGINSNALSRAVVIHPASYVTPGFIKQNGYAGRSWGCFAVNPNKVDRLIQLMRGGSVLFAYASPESRDPAVDHGLSYEGERLYSSLTGATNYENPVARFFHWI